jgi:DNA-binding GntR family transcriptional regulator
MPTKRTAARAGDEVEAPAADQSPTLADAAYRRIRQDIISGALKPGQPLRLETLKQRYGFSFSPIREALNRLQTERLAVAVALRGFSVAPLSRDEIRDATDTRILIECEALRRSIRNGDGDWEAKIVATFHALSWHAKRVTQADHAPDSEAVEGLENRHRDFHRALIAACNSPRLLDLANQLYAQTERYRRPALVDGTATKTKRNLTTEHKNIMDAALNRDDAKACELLTEHYRSTAASIEKFISNTQ